jgi:nitronate monooxygenase
MANALTSRLGIEHPVIQGPFGGLSTPRLVAGVSNLGGLGSFGLDQVAPDQIGPTAAAIRALTDKPFNLNLWVSFEGDDRLELDEAEFERLWTIFEPYYRELGVAKPERPRRYRQSYEDQFEAVLEAEPAVFSTVFGVLTPDQIARCRKKGIAVVGTATTVAEALVLEEAGVDAIAATGFEAGGHRVSFLKRAEDSLMGTFVLTQLVSSRVKVPVISAGGVADAQGVKAAMVLGAQAAQVGTAFLACEESGASPEHRAALFTPAVEDTVLTRAFSGRLGRGLRNRWLDEMPVNAAPYPVQAWFTNKLKPAARAMGSIDLVSTWSSQIAPKLKHRSIPPLMAELTNL